MMATQNRNYGEGHDYAAVQLPYEDGELSMVFLLPAQSALDTVQASLTTDRTAAILESLELRSVALTLPCFKINSSLDLHEPLARLGMPLASTDAANFSGINGKGGLSLSTVVRQAFIDVDEARTEAAAATTVGFAATAAHLPAEIHFDRPYLFIIRDSTTGTILLLGRVDDLSL